MGFGIGLGPRVFRVRVSTRGVGVSSGVGPFSIYAHSGRRRRRRPTTSRRTTRSAAPAQADPVFLPGDTTTTNLIGAGAHELVPTGLDELVTQLNRAQRWITGWCWAAFVCMFFSFVTPWSLIPMALTLVIAIFGFARRRVLLNYEVDSELSTWFDALVAGWPSLAATHGKWRAQTSTRLHQTHHQKVNAGAGQLVARHRVTFQTKTPIALKTNVKVPTIKAKRHSLIFLPDRVLVKTGSRWSDVDYNHLEVRVSQSRFIESRGVPRDGVKVGETWQYTNVKGGPDRRFKNNRRLPVMLYSDVALTSPHGLGWDLSLSQHEVATWWKQVLRSRPQTPLLTSALLADTAAVAAPGEPGTTPPVARVDVTAPDTPRGPIPTPPQPALVAAPVASPAAAPMPRLAKCKGEHVPPSPTGEPLEPWGRPWSRIEVAGESHNEKDLSALFAGVIDYQTPGGAESEEKAVMMPDPNNPHGEGHAIAVFVCGRHVGYVPQEESIPYFSHVAAMTAKGSAVTVDARVWASSSYYGSGFRGRVTLSVPEPSDFDYPESMPDDENAVLLPAGNALQVTGEEKYIDFLLPYVGQNVAVTLHNVTIERGRKPVDLVEVRLDGEPVGTFTPATSVKVGPLVDNVERVGGLPVARARVAGNSMKADVTVYVARAGDVPQEWIDSL